MGLVVVDAARCKRRLQIPAAGFAAYITFAVSMNQLFDLLRSVPDVIWSGVIASLLTLGGVLISNRSNTKRLLTQLHHDANEKTKERNAALRREVYLHTVEELTRANAHLASLPQTDPTKTNLADGLQGFFEAAAKLQLVAEPKTALLVNQLVATYTELLIKLMARVVKLHEVKLDINNSDDLYNKEQAEVTRVLAEMSKFNESAQANGVVHASLQRSLNEHQTIAAKHAENRSAACEKFSHLNEDFCRQLITDMQAIGEEQIPVLVEIRRDLGLTTDLNAFREQMQTNWKRMFGQMDAFLLALRDG